MSIRERPDVNPDRHEVTVVSEGALTAALLLAAVVAAVTMVVHAGLLSSMRLAASPERVADGQVWRLVTDGVVVQRPLLLSLVSFALLSLLALRVCGRRLFLVVAAVGHVGSTLLSYSLVAAVFSVDAGAARGVLDLPDYGVSAMQASWIGALAAIEWRRDGQTRSGRLFVGVGCLMVAGIALLVRSELTLLDADHVFAFAVGVALAAVWGSPNAVPLVFAARGLGRRIEHMLPTWPRAVDAS
jgi:hypothetical protein